MKARNALFKRQAILMRIRWLYLMEFYCRCYPISMFRPLKNVTSFPIDWSIFLLDEFDFAKWDYLLQSNKRIYKTTSNQIFQLIYKWSSLTYTIYFYFLSHLIKPSFHMFSHLFPNRFVNSSLIIKMISFNDIPHSIFEKFNKISRYFILNGKKRKQNKRTIYN